MGNLNKRAFTLLLAVLMAVMPLTSTLVMAASHDADADASDHAAHHPTSAQSNSQANHLATNGPSDRSDTAAQACGDHDNCAGQCCVACAHGFSANSTIAISPQRQAVMLSHAIFLHTSFTPNLIERPPQSLA